MSAKDSLQVVPWDDRTRMRAIARQAVTAAAKQVGGSTRSWLTLDERGTWEGLALDLLAKTPQAIANKVKIGEMTAERAEALTLTEIVEQISVALALTAVSSELSFKLSSGSPR
jgi:hypothetical protein